MITIILPPVPKFSSGSSQMPIYITVSGVGTSPMAVSRSAAKTAAKPTWNPNKVYQYFEDMSAGFQSYKKQATAYYSAQILGEYGGGAMSLEELKKQIGEWFPEYTRQIGILHNGHLLSPVPRKL